mgnify:FL=1
MARLLNKFLASASVVAGLSGVFGAPAMAATMTKATVNGAHLIYGINEDGNTDHETDFSVLDALNTDGANVELSGTRDHNKAVDTNNATTLTTEFDDDSTLVFSSLTNDIWGGSAPKEGYDNFAEQWFDEAWNSEESGLQDYAKNKYEFNINQDAAFLGFMGQNWFHRFSDPNVESVTKNGRYVSFDLSGHLNYEDEHGSLKMSEVVMVNDRIFYAFGDAIDSGVNNGDEQSSHSGIHAFTYKIPEPSAVLGLMAIGGMVAATKRRAQK